jgi:hypothetical protein
MRILVILSPSTRFPVPQPQLTIAIASRTPWNADEGSIPRIDPSDVVNVEGYLNVASQLGLSGERGLDRGLFHFRQRVEADISTQTTLHITRPLSTASLVATAEIPTVAAPDATGAPCMRIEKE